MLSYSVWLGCRDAEHGEQAAVHLRETGIDARALPLDVTDEASVAQAVGTFGHARDHLDVLVNNAGINIGGAARPSEAKIEDIVVVLMGSGSCRPLASATARPR